MCIFNMVLNRLSDPCSKRMLKYFQDDVYGAAKFEIQHYYRTMDYLINDKDFIEKEIFKKLAKKGKRKKVDLLFFDTTTVVYYGDRGDEEESSLLDFGFSKARRSDLKQLQRYYIKTV